MSQIEMAVRRVLMAAQRETVLIAVSGGVDSLALLHAALTVRRRLAITVTAATLDHGLRGPDGAADADHVVRLADEWGVACVRGALDPGALDSTGVGLEAAARTARYAFLADTARSVGAKWVAVGHHADDQAETVLAHLVRGAGLDGLAAMRAIAPLPGHADLGLLRPLLTVRRAAIEGYADHHAIVARHDASNDDARFTRNRIRHELIPLLTSMNAGAVEALVRLADNSAHDVDFLEQAVDVLMADPSLFIFHSRDQVLISRAGLTRLHPALMRRLLLRAIGGLLDLTGDDSLTHVRLSAVITYFFTGKSGKLRLGDGLQARFSRDWLALSTIEQ